MKKHLFLMENMINKIKYSQFDFDIDRTKNECFKAKKCIFKIQRPLKSTSMQSIRNVHEKKY